LAENGLNTWASMEPYPTPELDKTAEKIDTILERISFVKKIVFGKLNYRRMSTVNNNYNKSWKNNEDFYKEMADKIIDFCQKNNIKYHIKFGTPLSKPNTTNIFKD
jgi:GH35 family endo-1,4-beta-xylanase